MEKLELRMYGIVPYNISPIQQAIQFGHAVVEYGQMAKTNSNVTELYDDWADNWKTFIILNGGTTNDKYQDEQYLGSLNNHKVTLMKNDIKIADFEEPDLNDALTAVVFIVDERVFNRKKYPDFGDWVLENHFSYLSDNLISSSKIEKMRQEGHFLKGSEIEREIYTQWSEFVGGEKNIFLRDFLKGFKLA
jgi:hypothetical protein